MPHHPRAPALLLGLLALAACDRPAPQLPLGRVAGGQPFADGDAAIVGLTRATNDIILDVEVTAALGFAAQLQLHDQLGGPDATVGALGKAKITIPASAAVILAP